MILLTVSHKSRSCLDSHRTLERLQGDRLHTKRVIGRADVAMTSAFITIDTGITDYCRLTSLKAMLFRIHVDAFLEAAQVSLVSVELSGFMLLLGSFMSMIPVDAVASAAEAVPPTMVAAKAVSGHGSPSAAKRSRSSMIRFSPNACCWRHYDRPGRPDDSQRRPRPRRSGFGFDAATSAFAPPLGIGWCRCSSHDISRRHRRRDTPHARRLSASLVDNAEPMSVGCRAIGHVGSSGSLMCSPRAEAGHCRCRCRLGFQ